MSKAVRALLLCFAALCGLAHAHAAKHKKIVTPAERVCVGTVVNDSGAPIENATVFLQDTKSQVIRSYVTHTAGEFHFNQLLPDTDYDVWAEVNKVRSKTKVISMFSSHATFRYKLKVKS